METGSADRQGGLGALLERVAFPVESALIRRKLEAVRHQTNEYGLDPFGMDLDAVAGSLGPLVWAYRRYFRVRTYGLEKIPKGRFLLAGNHSGQLPLDGAMVALALLLEAEPPRVVRSMLERWVPTLPFVSTFFARAGQVVGTPENCIRLLNNDEAILVFPEGTRGINKVFAKRYQLASFGQGFMRLALETDAPIVPVAIIGAEEQAPALLDIKPLARLLKMPAFPITPTILPFPLPARYHIYFGDPLHFKGRPNDSDSVLERKVLEVRSTIQSMINVGLKERKSVFF